LRYGGRFGSNEARVQSADDFARHGSKAVPGRFVEPLPERWCLWPVSHGLSNVLPHNVLGAAFGHAPAAAHWLLRQLANG
jgi:hypothetical protein